MIANATQAAFAVAKLKAAGIGPAQLAVRIRAWLDQHPSEAYRNCKAPGELTVLNWFSNGTGPVRAQWIDAVCDLAGITP
jgi:hypothetical protein